MVDLPLPALLYEPSHKETISPGALSAPVRVLIQKIMADQNLLWNLFESFIREGKLDWVCLEKLAGPLSVSDKRLLELIADLFVPDYSLEFVVSGNWHLPGFVR